MKKIFNILLIDDQPEITEIVQDLIEDRFDNIEVTTFNNPKEALKNLKDQKYVLIITDHHMPEMSGTSLLSKIRTQAHLNEHTPVVFLTAMEKEVQLEIENKFPNVTVINKINHVQEIIDVIEKHIIN